MRIRRVLPPFPRRRRRGGVGCEHLHGDHGIFGGGSSDVLGLVPDCSGSRDAFDNHATRIGYSVYGGGVWGGYFGVAHDRYLSGPTKYLHEGGSNPSWLDMDAVSSVE